MSNKHTDPRSDENEKPKPGGAAPAVDACGTTGSPASAARETGAPNSSDDAKVVALQAELSALREELSAVNDKYLRKLADDVNFRKRMAREKEEGQRYAVAALLGDLVPVLDDFDRAIASAELSREYAVLHDGVALIRRQLGQMLENKYGLARFSALGQPFDPNRHEAVAMTPAAPGADGPAEAVVEEEFLPGYGLHDRILRTAKVRVRMPAASPAPAAGEAAPGGAAGDGASGQAGGA